MTDERGPRGPQGPPGGITKGAAYAVVFLFCLSFLLAGGAFWLASREVSTSEHKWCSTLDLLTSHRVPKPTEPQANPSREQAWIFYSDFVSLRQQLGCA